MAVDSQAPQANGLKTVLDTIVAPKEAFESIRVVPTWGWALAIAIVLSALGSYLTVPAIQHAIAAGWGEMVAQNPRLGSMPPADQQSAMAVAQKFASFGWLSIFIIVPVFCLIESVIMLIFDKLGRGEGSFAKYFAASCNIAVPAAGISSIVVAIITIIRGADSFNNPMAIQAAMPSLAMVIPATMGTKLWAFLATFTPFTIWATGLSIAAMLIVGRVPKLQAWLAGIVLFLVPSLIAVASAK